MSANNIKTSKKFVSQPETLISGAGIGAITKNPLGDEVVKPAERVLAQYGISRIVDNLWYPDQLYLDMLKAIGEQPRGMSYFVAIGMNVIETAVFPPSINSLLAAFESFAVIHDLNKRNRAPEDTYTIRSISQTRIQVIDGTPYPHEVIYGFIHAMTRRFISPQQMFRLERTYLNPNNPNDGGALYNVFIE